MTTMPVPLELGRAACSDDLTLVDAAFDRPGGPEAQEMKRLCRECPVRDLCGTWAVVHPEFGVWGGTTPKQRTIHGAPSASRHTYAPGLR